MDEKVSFTHFLHELHQTVDKGHVFCCQDEILTSQPNAILAIEEFAVFIIEIALRRSNRVKGKVKGLGVAFKLVLASGEYSQQLNRTR